ncbi:BatA domain-containing protein [Verrucomicrobium spinosum]|uniref:BatA domain-containing protein n=1 Tax=Verrucomicrobium spinosum TaxID=2736 RepID=UPI0001746ACA|nr:BatA domain-containing protein [Verrucomicrobium spinosum]
MNLLFPFFLIGMAAVAVPILLHFRRQPPQKSVPFSSLMFLEQTPVPPRTRRKLEDWLLLLLRCLALLLLALMFARPYFRTRGDMVATTGTTWCLLVDTSASMNRPGAVEEMKKRLSEATAILREQDHVMLATFDKEPRELLGFETWQSLPEGGRKAELQRLLDGVKPGWQSTDLGRALRYAAGRFQGQAVEGSRKQRIVLVSDLQEGSALEALHADSWPDKVTVTPLVVNAPWKDNFALSTASVMIEEEAAAVPGKGAAPTGGEGAIRVRVTSGREAAHEKFTLKWAEGRELVEASVPPGGSRIVRAPGRPDSTAAADGELHLSGDAVDFDNQLYVAKTRARELRIVCVGDRLSRTDTASPLFYLVRAFQPTATLKPVLVEKTHQDLGRVDLPGTAVVFAFGEGTEGSAAMLKDWVQAGGALVYVAQEGDKGGLLRAITGEVGWGFKESASGEALLQDLAFDHITLRAFAEAGVRDFNKVRFWKHRQLVRGESADAPAGKGQVLARFDDRVPAWMEWTAASGRLLYVGASWTGAESQFAVSSKFVPWLYGLLDWASGGTALGTVYTVGDSIPAAAGNWQGTVSVTGPDGKTALWDAAEEPTFSRTSVPGIYRFGTGEAAQSIAVNLAAAEGRLAPLPVERLTELGVTLEPSLSGRVSADAAAALVRREDALEEQRQKLWKAALLAALIVLLMETWLAGRREGKARNPEIQPA